MKKDEKSESLNRRGFLRGMGVAAAAVPAAALSASPAQAAQAADDGSSSGYQETDHVRRAYATARF